MENQPEAATIVRLIGVYDADGSLRGEITYWVGARLGRAHCALCDITHGLLTKRRGWQQCQAGLPVPFDTFHRDNQPEAVRQAVSGQLPSVLAETEAGLVVLVGPDELDAGGGSGEGLTDAIEMAVARERLAWPSGGSVTST